MKWLIGIVITTALAISTGPGHAQVVDKKALTLEGARQVIATAIGEARRLQAPGGVIAVVDDGGNLVALERLDGTFPAGAAIAIGKARTAAIFRQPTGTFEDIIRSGRTPMLALSDFTPLQGGVPLVVGEDVVGAIGVSGAASAQQDEAIALAGAAAARALKPGLAGAATTRKVTFIDSRTVAAGFDKGAVLVNTGHYMVHASHRDADGIAELHTLDTDIIYVLEGAATLVTGGGVPEARPTEPNELRGPTIVCGDTRRVVKGDVIVVPAGVPHMFRDVHGPLNYYVVKVR